MASFRLMDLVDSHGKVKREVLLQRNMTKGKKQLRFYSHNEKLIKVIHEYLRFRKQDKTYLPEAPLIRSQKGGFLIRILFNSCSNDSTRM